jgi:hypothetical protein
MLDGLVVLEDVERAAAAAAVAVVVVAAAAAADVAVDAAGDAALAEEMSGAESAGTVGVQWEEG